VDAGENVRGLCPFGDAGDGFRFGKDGAVGGKLHRFFRLQRKRADLIERDAENFRNHLQKASGAGRAFFAHEKIGDPTFGGDAGRFGELAADVDDRPRRREKNGAAPGLAGNVRNLSAGIGGAGRAEPRDNHSGQAVQGQACLRQCFVHDFFGRVFVIAAGRNQARGDHPLVTHDGRFDRDRPDVEAGEIFFYVAHQSLHQQFVITSPPLARGD